MSDQVGQVISYTSTSTIHRLWKEDGVQPVHFSSSTDSCKLFTERGCRPRLLDSLMHHQPADQHMMFEMPRHLWLQTLTARAYNPSLVTSNRKANSAAVVELLFKDSTLRQPAKTAKVPGQATAVQLSSETCIATRHHDCDSIRYTSDGTSGYCFQAV
jgi:hypothetical protein